LEHVLGGLSEYWHIYLGGVLLLVVLFARGGIIGLVAGREQRHD
jgi:branched-chain amino acid transport system permease protein